METLNENMLDALHRIRRNKSVAEISKALGVSRQWVYDSLKASPPYQVEGPTKKKLIDFLRLNGMGSSVEGETVGPDPEWQSALRKLNDEEKKVIVKYTHLSGFYRGLILSRIEKIIDENLTQN